MHALLKGVLVVVIVNKNNTNGSVIYGGCNNTYGSTVCAISIVQSVDWQHNLQIMQIPRLH